MLKTTTLFFTSCIVSGVALIGCAKINKEQNMSNQDEKIVKDAKRLESYNKLDNLKEGIWRVDEWKALAKQICDDSNRQDCSILAEIYYNDFYGYGTKHDRKKALEILTNSCMHNDSQSCFLLANLASSSEYPVEESSVLFTKAHDLALKNCSEYYGADCFVLAQLYFEGNAPFDRDRAKAKTYAYQACNMGYARACIFLGINADTREEAQGVYKQACNLGVKAHCK